MTPASIPWSTRPWLMRAMWTGAINDEAAASVGAVAWKAPNQAAIDDWKQGGLATVSAHLYNPANPNGGGLRDKGVDLKMLLTAGSDTHTRWLGELDQLATGLQELEDAGVVV